MRAGVDWQKAASGSLLVALALAGLWFNRVHALGTADSMGPGYLPMLTFAALGLVGAVLLADGARRGGSVIGQPPWRALAAVIGAVALFALLVEETGLAIAVAATALLSTFASRPWRPLRSLALAAFLVAMTWLIFVAALGTGLRFFPWSG